MPRSTVPLRARTASFIVLGVVMLIALGGGIYWKTRGDEREVVEPAVPPRADVQSAVPEAAPPSTPAADVEPERPSSLLASAQSSAVPSGCSEPCAGVWGPEGESALRAKGGQARGCYNRAQRRNTALSGTIRLSVRIGSSGHVCSVKVTEDSLGDPEVTSCVTHMFRAGKFPAPRGGCVEANVPLHFVSP